VPEKGRAAEVQAAKVEQAAARYRKQGGMADQQLGAVLLSGEPVVRGGVAPRAA